MIVTALVLAGAQAAAPAAAPPAGATLQQRFDAANRAQEEDRCAEAVPLYAALERIDPRLVEAASDLYASPFTGFRKVIWPLSLPGVVAGTLLTFIPASGDYINATLLGAPSDRMVGNAIQTNFLQFRDYPIASALSFILMAIILGLVFVYIRRAGTEDLV